MLPTTRHNAFLGVEHLSSQSLMFTRWQNIAFVGSNTLVIQTQEQAKSKWSTTPRYCPSLQDITLWLNYHIDGQHYDGVPALKADGCKDVAIQDTVAQKPLILHTGFSTFFNSDSNKGEKRCWRRSEIQETTWRQTCASRFMSLTKIRDHRLCITGGNIHSLSGWKAWPQMGGVWGSLILLRRLEMVLWTE